MRDLEIRGAGELLGAEQHGHLAALGFELYVEMLGEAVAELSGQRRTLAARPVRIDARIDAFVPAHYIDSEAQKIDLHRRLSLGESEDELRELEAATVDRYGRSPSPSRTCSRSRRRSSSSRSSEPTTWSSGAAAQPSGRWCWAPTSWGSSRTPGYGDLRHRPQGGALRDGDSRSHRWSTHTRRATGSRGVSVKGR